MSEFTQEEELFIIEVKWAKIFEQAGIEAANLNGDLFPLRFFQQPLFNKQTQELLAYSMPISRMLESQSIKDIKCLEDSEGFTIEYSIQLDKPVERIVLSLEGTDT
jgi:hypothetical protein